MRSAFLAVPHTAATEMAAALVERGLKVVDLSADFRLKSAETYEQWYKVEHKRPDLLPEAVYGLPELYASDIAKARLVANPGCYPTSIILGMTAALADGLIETHASSRTPSPAYPARAVPPSSVRSTAKSRTPSSLRHRHAPPHPGNRAGTVPSGARAMTISFNPHLVPMNRGILSTIYAQLKAPLSQADAQRCMRKHGRTARGCASCPPASFPRPVMSVGRCSATCPSSSIPGPTVSSWYPSSTTSAAAHPAGHRQRQHHVRASGHDRAHALRHDAVRPAGGNRSACDARKTRKLA